ncbi:hypothetical protein D9619_012844 [Psilocybe cf. subviscida]|uniref:Uncharacterized protein n=1 Tax=Psilocybe cf. subviscida TaxID=2480587 RepID=A0A8H5EQP5_9AGAR|nr:hypothetical protein D9619_012844 [Psilocybe cf. subviscida]
MLLKALTTLIVACSVIVDSGAVECHGKVVVDSKPIVTTNGHTITMKRFNCTAISGRPEMTNFSKRDVFGLNHQRSAAQCTTANYLARVGGLLGCGTTWIASTVPLS